MNSRIFLSLFISTLTVLVLSLTAVIFIGYSIITDNERERTLNTAQILLHSYNEYGLLFFENFDFNGYRLTLIAPDGTVLFDSEKEEPLENHLNRIEVQQALALGSAVSDRYSQTLDTRTFYCALKTADGNVLRTAVTADSLLGHVKSLTILLIILFAITALTCLASSFKLTSKILRPLYEIDLKRSFYDVDSVYPEIKPFLQEIEKRQHALDKQNETLKSRHQEFLTITKSMAEGLMLLNSGGIILTVNKTAKKIFNIDDDVIGKSFLTLDRSEISRSLIFNDDVKKEGQSLKNAKESSIKSCELTRDGRDYLLRCNTIRFKGKTEGYAILIIDITDTKRAEKIRREFTANVSHELKTPLQSIIGAAELIENNLVKDEDIKEFAGRIRTQGNHLICLIDDIIFLSKLDERAGLEASERFSLNTLASQIIASLKSRAFEHNITLKLKGDEITFFGVYRYIYEIIYNLVDNAISYMGKEKGQVVVSLGKNGNREITITVSDTGMGIAREHQMRIFERFYRVEQSRSPKGGGTGLGLAIVKRAVLLHDGKIKLTSKPGEGSSFKITLPCKNNENIQMGLRLNSSESL